MQYLKNYLSTNIKQQKSKNSSTSNYVLRGLDDDDQHCRDMNISIQIISLYGVSNE